MHSGNAIITKRDMDIEAYELDGPATKEPTHVGECFVRFMGAEEFYLLVEGCTLRNETDHSTHALTNSRGFCFFHADDIVGDVIRYREFMYGIVGDYAMVMFRNLATPLASGYGVYADPYGDYDDTIVVSEFSTTTYDRHSMLPIAACLDPFDYLRPYDVMHLVTL